MQLVFQPSYFNPEMNLHILTRDVGQQNEDDGTDVNLAFQGLLHEVLIIIKQKIMTVSIGTNL